MHITMTRKEFIRGLSRAAAVSNFRNTTPILNCVRIAAKGGKIVMTSTDLDNQCRSAVEGDVRHDGAVCLDARRALRMVRAMTGETVTLSKVTEKNTGETLTVESAPVVARLRSIHEANDLPEMKIDRGEWKVTTVPEGLLHRALTLVMPAILTEGTRYYLNGIWVHGVAGRLVMVASDAYRLHRYVMDVDWPDGLSFILPTKAAKLLRSMVSQGGNRNITISGNHLNVEVVIGDDVLICGCIDGTFPDYTKVIPKMDKVKASWTVNRDMVRALVAVSSEASRVIAFDATARIASCKTPDGDEISVPLADATGDLTIGLNSRLLGQVCAIAGTIRLRADGAVNPVIGESEDPALTIVIMPMMIR